MTREDAIVPCGDAISRQAVDDAIYDYSRSCDVNYQQIMEFIEKIPSVTPQQKTGHWTIDTKGIITTLYRCSECNRTVRDDTGYSPYKDYPFCHCGAKMVESEEQA